MENRKEMVKEYLELLRRIKEDRVIVICKGCSEAKYSKNFDAYIFKQCDDCYNKMMKGITIPTF